MILVKGFLGWGNRKNGVEAYGPGGRWHGNSDGDLLGDALAREGDTEGSTLFVVSVSRSEIIADRTIEQRVEAAIRYALATLDRGVAPMITVTVTINDSTAEWLRTGCLLDFPPPAAEVLSEVRDALPVHCHRCAGCGQIADSTDGEPWSMWLDLPVRNAAAVTMGLVRPVACPACGGSGVRS